MWLRVHVLNLDLNDTLNTAICCIPLSHSDMIAQEFLGQIPTPIFLSRLCSLCLLSYPLHHLTHCPNGHQFSRCTMHQGIKFWSPLCSVITVINSQNPIKSTVCEWLWRNSFSCRYTEFVENFFTADKQNAGELLEAGKEKSTQKIKGKSVCVFVGECDYVREKRCKGPYGLWLPCSPAGGIHGAI